MPLQMIFQPAKSRVANLLAKRTRLETECVQIRVHASTLNRELLDRGHQFRRIALSTDRLSTIGLGNIEPWASDVAERAVYEFAVIVSQKNIRSRPHLRGQTYRRAGVAMNTAI